ncbi:MAG: glycosyltransferase family 9 protein [Cyanobacteriota bacterium]|nr:glycosyltransferase family 9 protein [Cyanobacteriota bacterium]
MRILALVPGGNGDQVLFFPTIETLKQNYPQAAIDVLVEPRTKPAYRVCPLVNEVLTFDYQDRSGLADYLNLLGMLRDREYDIVLSATSSWVLDLLLWLNGIEMRVGYQTSGSVFLTNRVPYHTQQYAAQRYHDLLAGIGLQTSCPSLSVTVPKADIEWAETAQKLLDIKESGYILVYSQGKESHSKENPPELVYPLQSWLQILTEIQDKQPDVPIVLLRGQRNQQFIADMVAGNPALKVASPPDPGKMAALIAGANLLLCTDGGPLQLAVAVGTYTIALCGATQRKKRLPPSGGKFIAIESPSRAIADIAPVNVLEKIWQG